MNVLDWASLLRMRTVLRGHDGWTRPELEAFQRRSLAELRSFAGAHSPFYRELHSGLARAPLEELPVVTKADLMARFDDLVTDRAVQLTEVRSFLETAQATDVFRSQYRVAATGGTTGMPGIFLANRREWTTVLASYARAYQWAGIPAGLTHRLRMAVVSSTNPSHQSSIVGATLRSRIVPTMRLDAAQPVSAIVDALNAFEPESLVGYASVLLALAEEQLAGRLRIEPRAVMSASEVLTESARDRMTRAFETRPINVYAATETAGIASECRLGNMHAYEDLVIAEIVDADNQPTPVGQPGTRLLVTVLWSRTQPLIRYELSDRVSASNGICPDDLPYRLLSGVEGREEEVLTLAGVTVHPNVFHAALQSVPSAGWQVIEHDGRLRVLLVRGSEAIDVASVTSDVRSELARAGAHGVDLQVEVVDVIPRTALGKAPLVRRA